MLFRIEDSNGLDSQEREYDPSAYSLPTIPYNELDYYIADQIRKEVNGSKKRKLLSYSKSLATCILKYDMHGDNELHILQDNGCVNSVLYQTQDGIDYCEYYDLGKKIISAQEENSNKDVTNLGACHNEQSVNICSRWLTGIFF